MSEEKICSIVGCRKPYKRSMKRDRIAEAIAKSNLKVKDSRSRTFYLCADHWKTVKKVFKKDTTKAERLRWGH
ncbi:MAG: hypothetical protein ACFFFK_13170 [Candidatus Thorarchaeota archaeon]